MLNWTKNAMLLTIYKFQFINETRVKEVPMFKKDSIDPVLVVKVTHPNVRFLQIFCFAVYVK